GRVQAITTAMAADLREMQQRYGNDTPAGDILGDLMHLDHSTAQAGRVADSIAVLTGARSGRRWTRPIPMESILRGAMARIGDYKRVRCHSTSTLAVIGYAAEGVIHALAELLDNAAKFSPPSSTVHVYVEEVQAGVTITVEDSGLVMSEEALRRAREAVSNGGDLTNLSGSRLGLAVVGALARRYGLSVSYRPSSRGGTAAVMLVPQRILKTAPQPSAASAPPAAPQRQPRTPAPQTAPSGRTATTEPVAQAAIRNASGLPVRRRGQTLAAAQRRQQAPKPPARRTPTTSAEGFGAFRAAVRKTTPNRTQEDEAGWISPSLVGSWKLSWNARPEPATLSCSAGTASSCAPPPGSAPTRQTTSRPAPPEFRASRTVRLWSSVTGPVQSAKPWPSSTADCCSSSKQALEPTSPSSPPRTPIPG